jgi:hypothetical protein
MIASACNWDVTLNASSHNVGLRGSLPLARLHLRETVERRALHALDMIEVFLQDLVFGDTRGEFLWLFLVFVQIPVQATDRRLGGRDFLLRGRNCRPLASLTTRWIANC